MRYVVLFDQKKRGIELDFKYTLHKVINRAKTQVSENWKKNILFSKEKVC